MTDYNKRLAHCQKRLAEAKINASKPGANYYAHETVLIWQMKCDSYEDIIDALNDVQKGNIKILDNWETDKDVYINGDFVMNLNKDEHGRSGIFDIVDLLETVAKKLNIDFEIEYPDDEED